MSPTLGQANPYLADPEERRLRPLSVRGHVLGHRGNSGAVPGEEGQGRGAFAAERRDLSIVSRSSEVSGP